MALSDQEMEKRIEDHLDWDSRLDASNIRVNVEDNRVTLTGTVPTPMSRKTAEKDVYDVQGDMHVDNRLTIEYPPRSEHRASDDEIERNIRNALDRNPDLNSPDITVAVQSGVVYLKGTVNAYWKREYAVDIARRAFGSSDVINWIAVTPSEMVSDEQVREDVTNAILRSTGDQVRDLEVHVRGGVVTLFGRVWSWNARRQVREAAANTRGVVEIKNNIAVDVRPPET
ncbi:MAG TPA: BON domain-containing protein [Methanomicrobiales archaeon]|nr:BON domain-containing protein [Methanomicrobiales archaeon]